MEKVTIKNLIFYISTIKLNPLLEWKNVLDHGFDYDTTVYIC